MDRKVGKYDSFKSMGFLYEKWVETRLRWAVGCIRNHSSYNLSSSLREHKCTRAFSLRMLHLKFLLHDFLLNFHATEDDSQPDCSRLLRQRSICHGELLLSVTLNADCGWAFFKCFPMLLLACSPGRSPSEGISLQLPGLVADILR